jgi:hypothetical protein
MRATTANLGNASDERVFHDLVAEMVVVDVIVCQEAQDRRRVIERACLKMGWHAYFGDTDAASATPVLWGDVHVDAKETVPLSRRTWTGRHPRLAGPSWVKAKSLVVVHAEDHGWIGSVHMPASQWWNPRLLLSLRDARGIATWSRGHHRVALGGDWNRKKTFRALVSAGFRLFSREVVGWYVKGYDPHGFRAFTTSSDHPMIRIEIPARREI